MCSLVGFNVCIYICVRVVAEGGIGRLCVCLCSSVFMRRVNVWTCGYVYAHMHKHFPTRRHNQCSQYNQVTSTIKKLQIFDRATYFLDNISPSYNKK